MKKIEMIIFAVVFVIFTINAFDFIIYVIKSAPKSAYLSKISWKVGLICMVVLVYWFVNGYKFF